jgi:hypothetical protein
VPLSVTNGCTTSTTYEWKKVKIQPPARAQGTARAKRAPSTGPGAPQESSAAELRAPHYVQIRMRGGAEMWWEVKWGGRTKRFPGYVPIDDVLLCLFTHPPTCKGHKQERTGD